MSAYTSTTAEIEGLAMTAAIENGKRDIRVNALHPGVVHTHAERTDGFEQRSQSSTERCGRFQSIPRMGETQEVSEVISFLLSDKASFGTGVSLPVDGGRWTDPGQSHGARVAAPS